MTYCLCLVFTGVVQVHKVTSDLKAGISCHPLKYLSTVLTLSDPDPYFTGKTT